jgi:hypothetical protein
MARTCKCLSRQVNYFDHYHYYRIQIAYLFMLHAESLATQLAMLVASYQCNAMLGGLPHRKQPLGIVGARWCPW